MKSYLVAGSLVVWAVAITLLASTGTFHVAPGGAPVFMLAAIILPPLAFLSAMNLSPRIREAVLSVDPVFLNAVQGWRVIGGGFLFLYAFGNLPRLFAWPAGGGDILVGLLAPFIAASLTADRRFLASRRIFWFHVLGVADFIGAVSFGIMSRGSFGLIADGPTTYPLGELPLALIPGFAVPLWLCLHITAFGQILRARRLYG